MAATSILNQIFVEIQVQGQTLPYTPNLINTISIHESINVVSPVMQFALSDTKSSMARDYALTEGTQISILVGKRQDSAVPHKFRLFGFSNTPTREGPRPVANFILDAPKYVTGSYTESYEGTSSDVISQIASKCGLQFDGTKTSDNQIWLNFGKSRAAFAEDISMHGYSSDSSCMARACSSEHKLIYKDMLNELNNTQPKLTLALNNQEGNKVIQVRDVRDKSVSGVMNTWINYGWKFPQHSLKGKEILHDKFDVQTTESYLPINSDVKSEIENQARVQYCKKLDCRNTHENYVKAYYTNLRGRALLGERLHVMIEEPSELQLLDVVEYRHVETDGHTGKNTGTYIVTAKVKYVAYGTAYYEKLELCRFSLRESGNTPLIG